MIKVGIVGGTGYTGAELLRLLSQHPDVEIEVVTSRSKQGVLISEIFPNLRGHMQHVFTSLDIEHLVNCDVVFFATPHGVAQSLVPEVLAKGIKVIDLSADFRIRDIETWEHWYNQRHLAPELAKIAAYGLPEVNRNKIRHANLVACAGCYPTSIQIGLLPLLASKSISTRDIIANSASGVSGAGRQANISNLLSEVGDSFKAYAGSGHRHLPEIEQGLSDIAGQAVSVTFVPHLLPISRGIHSTIYTRLNDLNVDVQSIFEDHYKEEAFVHVLPPGSHPETRSVRGSNFCHIAVHQPGNDGRVVVFVTEDNLTKGASGQAIQCMNLMFNLPEESGLAFPGLLP
ncbi:MAG: N-acetyl-gamma-glutamyl-phosphate reductase [Porticoccaceae bacterium]|nr:N-acetyl-gamma-glutamyl-phosphate reductase [Porticoccaceae bacterium]